MISAETFVLVPLIPPQLKNILSLRKLPVRRENPRHQSFGRNQLFHCFDHSIAGPPLQTGKVIFCLKL